MDTLRARGGQPLILELGDFMDPDPYRGPITNPFLVEVMEQEGTPALCPGPIELSHWSAFQDLLANRPIAVVSSNVWIRDGEERRPVGSRTYLVEHNGIRIGLLGILGKPQFDKIAMPSGITFEFQDPGEAIRELIGGLRPLCDLIVVMACMDDRSVTSLAKRQQGVDVMLGGHKSIASYGPLKEDDVYVGRCGMGGQYLSVMRLIVSPDDDIVDWGGRNIRLHNGIRADSTFVAVIDKIEEAAKEARLNGLRSKIRGAVVAPGKGHYLGAHTCRRCHTEEYEQWCGTPHARAYAMLVEAGGSKDPAVVARYVTGYGEPGGYDPASGADDFQNVQCEACHGPGSQHDRSGARARVGAAVCQSCHAPRWSPGWDYAAAVEKIRHWD